VIYLIGGPPRVGKTRLAQRLGRRLGIGWLSLDTLRFVLRGLLPEVDELAGFGRSPGRWADHFYPYVRDAVLSSAYVEGDYILEGVDFLPRHVRDLAAETPVAGCFLGLSAPDLALIDAHAGRMDYQKHESPAVREGFPAWIAAWTAEVQTECRTLGLPFFDLAGDYETQADRALQVLAAAGTR
jgi:2-phosphoglycerate kinase